MKKSIFSLFVMAFLAITFTSCDNNGGGGIIPDPGPGAGDHPELWHYEAPIKGLADIIPAIDGSGNIYIAGQEQGAAGGTCHVISVDKNGNERWSVAFEEADPTNVIYADGKVFFGLNDPVKIYALDASNGSTLWSKDLKEEYDFIWAPIMAFANQKLYVESGQMFENFLFAYNPTDGNELWVRRIYMDGGTSMAIKGDEIFFGGLGSITRYDDKGSSCDSVWNWSADKSSRSALTSNIAISDDGNIYTRDEDIYIISSATGSVVKTINLDASFENSYSSVTVDGDGNCYIGNGNLAKFSSNGDMVWQSDIHAGLVSPNYIQEPLIGENGKFYNGELFSLSCVKADGTLDWVLGTEAGVGNLHTVAMDNDGNLLSYATEKGILYCYKGDGSKLATKGWPKIYGTMGNTCSK